MAGGINKLSAVAVQKAKEPGYYGDGGGLWLQISKLGGKSWVFRFTLHGKTREMGLGPLRTISLAEALPLFIRTTIGMLVKTPCL